MLIMEPPPAPRLASPPAASLGVGFLPKEHGSWSLALEPIALGLLAAPSRAGGTLALAAVAGFFARRPLKLALAAAPSARRGAARELVVLLSALAAAGMFEALVLGGLAPLWPLLLVAPGAALFVHFDAQNESRAAAAELAGTTAFALLPAAFASLAGWRPAFALALAAAMAARSLPTVLTVRHYLRVAKGQPVRPLVPAAAGGLAVAGTGWLAARGLLPAAVAVLAVVLLLRSLVLLAPFAPRWPARRIGIIEAVVGLAYIVAAGAACHAGGFLALP
ncbi:MAG TPA: YwiC-like family protein [Lacunisphaera sp.]|nr:YwiC-like family protein [Lacunisphaera sp.]